MNAATRTAAITHLGAFARDKGYPMFAELCRLALDGEAWALERVVDALELIVTFARADPDDDPDAIRLGVIKAVDTARPGESRLDKVRYVKSQRQTRKHECHWPGCDAQVPPAMWGCRRHWFSLPKHLRDRIWETYRSGQEATMTPSEAYLEAADEVQRWIRQHGAKR